MRRARLFPPSWPMCIWLCGPESAPGAVSWSGVGGLVVSFWGPERLVSGGSGRDFGLRWASNPPIMRLRTSLLCSGPDRYVLSQHQNIGSLIPVGGRPAPVLRGLRKSTGGAHLPGAGSKRRKLRHGGVNRWGGAIRPFLLWAVRTGGPDDGAPPAKNAPASATDVVLPPCAWASPTITTPP